MPDKINVQYRAESLDVSPELPAVSKLIVNIDDDTAIIVGDDTGYTVETTLPFCTQQMAEQMLQKLNGYRYQPFTANGAILDPAAEIGDGVSIGDVYSGLYNVERSFGHLYKCDITVPSEEEIDHEYTYESPTERKYQREMGDLRASLILQSNEIAAKVSNTGGGSSFAWELMEDHWSVKSNDQEIFRVDQNGGTFTGRVVASEGMIGGFTITASSIYNNISEFGGAQSSGVYIGTDGIQLGSNFRVDSSGHMTCSGATVTGSIRANDIQTGGSNGYISGSMFSGGAIASSNLSSYCIGGISGGVGFNGAILSSGGTYPDYFSAKTIVARNKMTVPNNGEFRVGTFPVTWHEQRVMTSATTSITIRYLGN